MNDVITVIALLLLGMIACGIWVCKLYLKLLRVKANYENSQKRCERLSLGVRLMYQSLDEKNQQMLINIVEEQEEGKEIYQDILNSSKDVSKIEAARQKIKKANAWREVSDAFFYSDFYL